MYALALLLLYSAHIWISAAAVMARERRRGYMHAPRVLKKYILYINNNVHGFPSFLSLSLFLSPLSVSQSRTEFGLSLFSTEKNSIQRSVRGEVRGGGALEHTVNRNTQRSGRVQGWSFRGNTWPTRASPSPPPLPRSVPRCSRHLFVRNNNKNNSYNNNNSVIIFLTFAARAFLAHASCTVY